MLTKKDKKKRYNRVLRSRSGHQFDGTWKDQTEAAFEDNLGGAVGGLVGAASAGINAGIQNAGLQGVEEAQGAIDARQNFQSAANTNDDLLAEMASATNTKSDYTHKDFMQDGKTLAMNTINATLQGGASGASAGPWGAVAGAAAGLLGGIGGLIGGRVKAGVEAAEKNAAAKKANLAQAQTLTAKAGALDQAADARSLAAYYAEGGRLGKTPQFPEFPSSLVKFNTGGTHEENPYDGIPQGIAPDGLPNLVEEGEVKYNDYIFSDRLMLNKQDKKKYKFLSGNTYADAADRISKESIERPNDIISKNTRDANLKILESLQEKERQKRGLQGENRMTYKTGGHLFKGTTSYTPLPSLLQDYSFEYTGDKFSDDYYSQEPITDLVFYGNGLKSPQLLSKNQINPIKSEDLDFRNVPKPYRKPSNFSFNSNSFLQAAPVIGNAIGMLSQAFNTPDYKHAKELQQGEQNSFTPISYTPITQRMTYKPMDVNYYGSKLGAQAGATRQAIREQTATNPYAATAALLALDANAQGQLGDLYKKAEEYNLAQREKVNTFNRATDSANAEMAMKAVQLNASLRDAAAKRQLERDTMATKLKLAEDQAFSESMSASMTGLFDNLGAIGKENKEFGLAALKMLGEGKMTPEQFNLVFPQIQKILKDAGYYAKGGKLKKKKGYTI